MLTKEELLDLDIPPLIKNVSLELYKDFSINYLLARKFIYHFSDGSTINVEFTEWGIYHMLSIQHIDYRIKNDEFFQRIDDGLTFDDFKINDAIKARFKDQKKRISMFACTYNTLRKGQAFYIPSGKVKNTNNVRVDYILYRTLDNNNGMNIGIRQELGKFVPLTILISRQSSLDNYIDVENFKLVEKLEITDLLGNIIETISYAISKDAVN
ncbi:MAG: hypothetical protein HDR27_02425 [Lachnospiraceae bacterium]|nr:hypothetical protein [Lachnospiraceae bacterium]